MHWVIKLIIAWRVAPFLPATVGKMGACISAYLEVDGLKARVQELEQQAASGGGGGGNGVAHVPLGTSAAAEVLFFPDGAMPCRNGKSCRRQNCSYAHDATSLIRLLQWLNAARSSLDVAVFSITCDELADALLAAHSRGVRVRIISDNDQMATRGSDVERLKAAGVPVKVDNSPAHMHNKFAVLDGRFVLTGSFNWTRAGVLENQENVLILDSPQTAAKYKQQFDRLWNQY